MVEALFWGIVLAQAVKLSTFKDYSMKAIGYCNLFSWMVWTDVGTDNDAFHPSGRPV